MKNFKKWFESQDGYDIQNNPTYYKWLDKNHYMDFKFTGMLYRKNVEALKFLFGKQTAVWTGEFKFYVWKIDYNGSIFLIFSSNKGTSIEYVGSEGFDSVHIGEQSAKLVDSLVTNLTEYYETLVPDDELIKCLKANGYY